MQMIDVAQNKASLAVLMDLLESASATGEQLTDDQIRIFLEKPDMPETIKFILREYLARNQS
ncbi:MAG TPA: hypothetical protein VH933_17405 [Aestuariivirgaceae bacterium]